MVVQNINLEKGGKAAQCRKSIVFAHFFSDIIIRIYLFRKRAIENVTLTEWRRSYIDCALADCFHNFFKTKGQTNIDFFTIFDLTILFIRLECKA